ncbi:MAG: M42 family metallopeptidase [Clostridia bacterium]
MKNSIVDKAIELLAIPSPTGFTKEVSKLVFANLQKMGYEPKMTNKSSVVVCLGGQGDPILVTAHVDTLGAMVFGVKPNGRLKMTALGGLSPNNVETETCIVHTRTGKTFDGTIQMENASGHVNKSLAEAQRTFDSLEVVLDEKTSSKAETTDLGIETGDFICVNPRTIFTSTGFLKSRFLDDKLCAAILLEYAKELKETGTTPNRKVYLHFTVYEETGHGACASVPSDVNEILSLDMGCVGDGLACTEHEVSICVKDSRGPYDYDMTTKLIEIAKENSISYAADVYPFYGSDADAALGAGWDLRHALIGPGVYASHGYERSHIDGINATYELMKKYLKS